MCPPKYTVHDVYADFNRHMQGETSPEDYEVLLIQKGNPGSKGGGFSYDFYKGRPVMKADGKKVRQKWR